MTRAEVFVNLLVKGDPCPQIRRSSRFAIRSDAMEILARTQAQADSSNIPLEEDFRIRTAFETLIKELSTDDLNSIWNQANDDTKIENHTNVLSHIQTIIDQPSNGTSALTEDWAIKELCDVETMEEESKQVHKRALDEINNGISIGNKRRQTTSNSPGFSFPEIYSEIEKSSRLSLSSLDTYDTIPTSSMCISIPHTTEYDINEITTPMNTTRIHFVSIPSGESRYRTGLEFTPPHYCQWRISLSPQRCMTGRLNRPNASNQLLFNTKKSIAFKFVKRNKKPFPRTLPKSFSWMQLDLEERQNGYQQQKPNTYTVTRTSHPPLPRPLPHSPTCLFSRIVCGWKTIRQSIFNNSVLNKLNSSYDIQQPSSINPQWTSNESDSNDLISHHLRTSTTASSILDEDWYHEKCE